MSHFKTWDSAGKNLVDSNFVTFGLVKSGYLAHITNSQRKARTGVYTGYDPIPYYDAIHGFSVTAETPIVFIAGQAVLQQIVRNGNSWTYWYGHASTGVRFYVFDRMKDRGPAGAKIRLWDTAGVCTLDSGMPFLDINGSAAPPAPAVDAYGFGAGYAGGAVYAGSLVPGNTNYQTLIVRHSIAMPVAVADCAVSVPWARVMFHAGANGFAAYSAREGAFGSGGSVVYMMATEAGANINTQTPVVGHSYDMHQIPGPRRPTTTYIDAAALPIPFG